ncbi:MAG TPA: helix-turn-helix transcriptional regulator [Actinomycetota bacterium]|nr:helix-turn-helix transcriptional regulator [Actinomycetota bacterium]
MSELGTTSYAVLGLLSRGKMSRYDIVQMAERSIANFWTIAKSQVYGELGRLEDLGLVKGKEIAQKGLPDKRLYEITASGRKALKGWLESPGYDDDRFRSGFLVKWFFAGSMEDAARAELLAQYRSRAQAGVQGLESAVDSLASVPEAKYMRDTALLGLMVTRAVMEWTDAVSDARSKKSNKRGPKT